MKKFTFALLAALWGGVILADAADDIYLRSNLNANESNSWYSWNFDANNADASLNGSEYKFTYEGANSSNTNEDIYSYTIDASDISGDIYFRLWIYNWADQLKPSENQYTLDLSSTISTGYEVKSYWGEYKHTGIAENYFIISHSTIKASAYRIKLYKDNSTFTSGGTGKIYMNVDIVSMPATVGNLGYATFSCDRALDLSDANAYYASGLTDGKVVLTKATGKVPAETGLLLVGEGSKTIPVVPTSEASALDGNLLKASVTATVVAASTTGAYHYFLAGTTAETVGFYNVATTATSAAGKAYLETTTALATESTGARVAWIFENDGTTGIDSAKHSAERSSQNTLFDLEGRAVAQPTKGLYIKNGKKVIVR